MMVTVMIESEEKVSRCHLWRTKHCPEIELQQLWVLDTTRKWMCYYLPLIWRNGIWVITWKVTNIQSLLCLLNRTLASVLCLSGPSSSWSHSRDLPGWQCHRFGLGPSRPEYRHGMSEAANSCMLKRLKHRSKAGASVSVPSYSHSGASLFWFL